MLAVIKKYLAPPQEASRKIRYWCGDESRFGLKTLTGKLITMPGVRPLGLMQWKRDNFYLYGVVEPLSGESFFWEFSSLDTVCFQRFLEEFALEYPLDLHIIQVDNGAFHSSRYLTVPDNVILIFQPPHTPEVNPIERLWKEIKRYLNWECFHDLDELRQAVGQRIDRLSPSVVASVTGWDFILAALSVASIL